jgi:hypothetical protein
LEALESEETWSKEERRALDEKIDRALEQVAPGRVYGPEESRRKLAAPLPTGRGSVGKNTAPSRSRL